MSFTVYWFIFWMIYDMLFHCHHQLYFTDVFSAVGALLPFIALYMRQLGLSESETGIIYGTMPFIGFLTKPLLGAVSDRTGKPKVMLSASCILSALFYVLLLVVPRIEETKVPKIRTSVICDQFDSYISDCFIVNRTTSQQKCPVSFDDYLLLHQRAEATTENYLNNSIRGNNSFKSYTVIDNSEEISFDNALQCTFRCHIKSSSISVSVCFTNDSNDLTNSKCSGVETKREKESHLTFTLANVSDIAAREVKQDRQRLGNEECRDYDLKSLMYKDAIYFQMLCQEEATLSCDAECSNDTEVNCVNKKETSSSETFWLFFVIFLFANIAFSPVVSLGDAMAYDILGQQHRNRWGKQRLWGTVSFAILALGTTFIMDEISEDKNNINFSISFYICGVFFVASGIVACLMPISDEILCSGMVKHIRKLLSHGQVTVFLCVILLFGFFTGCIEAFLFWFLADELKNTQQIIPGLALLFNCISETFLLFAAGYIIKRISHLYCLYIVMITYAVRFIGYSFLSNPWQVLIIEPTHGVTFGIMWATATSYASIITPKGLSGTVQGLLGGIHFGLGIVSIYCVYHT